MRRLGDWLYWTRFSSYMKRSGSGPGHNTKRTGAVWKSSHEKSSQHVSTSKNRFSRLFCTLVQCSTQEPFATYQYVLQFLPLQFKDALFEKRFLDHYITQRQADHMLLHTLSNIFFLTFCISFFFYSNYALTLLQQFTCIIFSLNFLLLIMVACILIRSVLRTRSLSPFYSEIVSCVIMILMTFGPLIWSTFCTSYFNFSKYQLSNYTPNESVMLFKSLTIHFVFGFPLFSGVFFNLFSCGRTKVTLYPQLFLLTFLFLSNFIQTALRIYLSARPGGWENSSSYLILMTFFESFFFSVVFGFCYIQQWTCEFQDRIAFWTQNACSKTMHPYLHDSVSVLVSTPSTKYLRRQRKFHSNAVEDLLQLVVRATSYVQDARSVICKPSLDHSTELLRELQKSLTDPDNLYAVQVFQRSASFQKSQNKPFNVPLETRQLEAEFLEIFANRKTCLRSEDSLSDSENDQVTKYLTKQSQERSPYQVEALFPSQKINTSPRTCYSSYHSIFSLHDRNYLSECFGKRLDWNFFKQEERTPHLFAQIGLKLLRPLENFLKTSQFKIKNYIQQMERLYYPNPFHNALHVTMVSHYMWYFLRILRIHTSPAFTPLDYVAITLGCLGHDIGHPGRNNQFLFNSLQEMTLLYNDQSVLENYHCALVFKCLQFDSCDIFEFLEAETIKELRKKIISLILVTDMEQHFEFLSRFRLRYQAEDFNFRLNPSDMWLLIRLCMKCADLCHAFLDWPQHHDWELRLAEEHYQQGEAETLLGLHPSPLCERKRHDDFPRTRRSFLDCLVFPMIIQLEQLDDTHQIRETCIRPLLYNKKKWEKLHCRNQTIEIPEAIRHIPTHPYECKTLLSHLLLPKGFELKPNRFSSIGRSSFPSSSS